VIGRNVKLIVSYIWQQKHAYASFFRLRDDYDQYSLQEAQQLLRLRNMRAVKCTDYIAAKM